MSEPVKKKVRFYKLKSELDPEDYAEIQEKRHQYYEANKQKFRDGQTKFYSVRSRTEYIHQRKEARGLLEPHTCECGSTIMRASLKNHLNSKTHFDKVQALFRSESNQPSVVVEERAA